MSEHIKENILKNIWWKLIKDEMEIGKISLQLLLFFLFNRKKKKIKI